MKAHLVCCNLVNQLRICYKEDLNLHSPGYSVTVIQLLQYEMSFEKN